MFGRYCVLGVVLAGWCTTAATGAVANEPPPARTAGTASTPTSSGIRADHSKLKNKLEEVEKAIKAAEQGLQIGQEAGKTWKDTSERVNNLIETHKRQSAACELAKDSLKNRRAEGDAEVYLRSAKRHVDECSKATIEYDGMIAAISQDVQTLLKDINQITRAMDQLRLEQTEALERKSLILQLIDTNSQTVRRKVQEFQNFQGH